MQAQKLQKQLLQKFLLLQKFQKQPFKIALKLVVPEDLVALQLYIANQILQKTTLQLTLQTVVKFAKQPTVRVMQHMHCENSFKRLDKIMKDFITSNVAGRVSSKDT